jgi:hypothetical protein
MVGDFMSDSVAKFNTLDLNEKVRFNSQSDDLIYIPEMKSYGKKKSSKSKLKQSQEMLRTKF